MRATYLLNLNGLKYAVWKDEVESVREVETIHQLPFSPPCIAGLAIIDKTSIALADLAALIGLPPFDRDSRAQLLLVAGKKKDAGFVFSGEIQEISIPEDEVLQIPAYVKTSEISTCIIHLDETVPVIDLIALFQHIHSADLNPSLPSLEVPKQHYDFSKISSIRLITAGGEVFALPAETVLSCADKPRIIAPVPLTPPEIKGLAFTENSIAPIIHLAEKMALPGKGRAEQLLTIHLADNNFGLLVDNDLGTFAEKNFSLQKLPPLAESSLINIAAIRNREIIPLINPVSILDPVPSLPDEDDLAAQYQPDSQFGNKFDHDEVDVIEFSLLGVNHALPESEVEDVLPISPIRRVPELQSLVIGIVEHQGEILPVLDLALVFGRRSLIDSNWRMVLIKNGSFRALVVTEAVSEKKTLPRKLQKKVPITLPRKLVYGCYPDGNIVRLIVNVAALAIHFDKNVVEEFLRTLTKEMAETPAEIVPSLLPEEEVVRLEKERKLREGQESRQREIEEARKLAEEKAAREEQERLRMQEELKAQSEEARLRELMTTPLSGEVVEEEAIQSEEETARRLADRLAELEAGEETLLLQDEDTEPEEEVLTEDTGDLPITGETAPPAEEVEDREEELAKAEEEQIRLEELARKEEEEKQRQLAEQQRRGEELAKAEEERIRLEELARKEEEEKQRQLAEQQRREEELAKAEEERLRLEELARKKEEEKQRQLAEQQRCEEELAKAEEERLRLEELARKKEEEKQRQLAEQQRREEELAKAEEERLRLEELAIKKEQETKQKEQADNKLDDRQQLEEMLIAGADAQNIQAEPTPDETVSSPPNRARSKEAPGHEISPAEDSDTQRTLEKEQRAREAEKERIRILAELEAREEKSNRANKRLILLMVLLLIIIIQAFFFFGVPDKQPEQPDIEEKEIILPESSGPEKIGETEKTSPPETADEKGTETEIIAPTYEAGKDLQEEIEPSAPDYHLDAEKDQSLTISPRKEQPLTIIVPGNIPIKSHSYTVKKGDTLWHISKRFTGNPYNYPFVARENRIPNPDLIYPKQKIILQRESQP